MRPQPEMKRKKAKKVAATSAEEVEAEVEDAAARTSERATMGDPILALTMRTTVEVATTTMELEEASVTSRISQQAATIGWIRNCRAAQVRKIRRSGTGLKTRMRVGARPAILCVHRNAC